jgi:FdhD protein
VVRWSREAGVAVGAGGVGVAGSLELLDEEPLLIRVDGSSYAVLMRTPGDEIAHAAGFCLAEGIADSPDDLASIGFCEAQDSNVVEVRLTPERRGKIPELLARRGFVGQSSCGICGKALIEDLHQRLTPVEDGFAVDLDFAFDCVRRLSRNQACYRATRSAHAALILDDRLQEIAFAEDVGRHNALDKAIGKAFLDRKLQTGRIAVLSSRNSYEMVQKVARARLPVVISNSRPTALAVKIGKALNLTLAFLAGESELVVVCGAHRLCGAAGAGPA